MTATETVDTSETTGTERVDTFEKTRTEKVDISETVDMLTFTHTHTHTHTCTDELGISGGSQSFYYRLTSVTCVSPLENGKI